MSPADNMTPPKVGVMAPLQSAEIGVSNGVKIGRFWTVSQPLFWGGHSCARLGCVTTYS